MNLPDLKQLDKLLTLARKHGVEHIKVGDMEFKLGEVVQPTSKSRGKAASAVGPLSDPGPIGIPTDTPSEEDLLFWSASGQLDENGEIPKQ